MTQNPAIDAEFPELSCYLLPGHSATPKDAMNDARQAEALGLGRVWASERFDAKDSGIVCSAALAVTERIKVCTGATNLHTRHPQVLANMCSTLHHMSDGRFELGLARGVAIRNQLMGLENVSNAKFEEGLELLRTMWRGEKIIGHDGLMGKLPYISMGEWAKAEIPIHFVGFGEKSLRWAGKHFDGVHLHTFITPQGLRRAKTLVQEGAADAGRDPDSVKVWSVFATALNPTHKDYLKKLIARMATYMQAPGYVELLAELNGWDVSVLETVRNSEPFKSVPGGIDIVATEEQLEEIAQYIPDEWLPAAYGDAETCAKAWLNEFEHGADGLVIHGSTPQEFAPIIDEYRRLKQGS